MRKISKRDINRLAHGEVPFTMSGTPFIVMHQSVSLRMTGEQSFQWNIDFSSKEEDSIEIDRETALKIIEAHAMELAYDKKYGQIYELPGRPFLKTYENAYGTRSRAKAS